MIYWITKKQLDAIERLANPHILPSDVTEFRYLISQVRTQAHLVMRTVETLKRVFPVLPPGPELEAAKAQLAKLGELEES